MPIFRQRRLRGVPVARWVLIAWVGVAASGCSSLRYYVHVAQGEMALLARRKPVAELIADPALAPELRTRLEQARAAREFASDHLDLPRNRSYTTYVALNRPFVTWNVFAAPEFSIAPITHCFPFAGCVAYLGFFERARAERAARKLAARGHDTDVVGVAAYSTLGWFADPILSSMLRWNDDELDATIFHELAHQKLYVKDDTAFNESYATFVQEQGLREWRAARGLPAQDGTAESRDDAFTGLVLGLRERLRALYARALPPSAMRAAKEEDIAAFRLRYATLRDSQWHGDRRWDAWVAKPINNARLVPFGLYDRWKPAFARLFQESGAQWPRFFARVQALAEQPQAARDETLRRLAAGW